LIWISDIETVTVADDCTVIFYDPVKNIFMVIAYNQVIL